MSTPEVIHDMPMPEYRAVDAISNSGLSALATSPAHYQAYMRSEKPDTPAMRLGRLIHKAVLEPEMWAGAHAVAPAVDRRTKAGKEAYAAFLAESEGRHVVTPDEANIIEYIRSSVHEHRAAYTLLLGGRSEVSIFWTDTQTGERCKCRPDYLRDDGIVVDLKTVEDASPAGFPRAVWKWGWYRQAALYSHGVEVATGEKVMSFIFIAVEKVAPFAVGCYVLDNNSLFRGRCDVEDLLVQYSECKARREWPAYSDKVETITLPAWANKTED